MDYGAPFLGSPGHFIGPLESEFVQILHADGSWYPASVRSQAPTFKLGFASSMSSKPFCRVPNSRLAGGLPQNHDNYSSHPGDGNQRSLVEGCDIQELDN